jgi:hypothetical protein
MELPGLYSLELGGEVDNYSDFGSTEKPKVFCRSSQSIRR